MVGKPGRAFAPVRYRTLYPLLTLLQPTRLGEAVQGWVNAYKEGGWLPAWSAPGCCHLDPARRGIPHGVVSLPVWSGMECARGFADWLRMVFCRRPSPCRGAQQRWNDQIRSPCLRQV